MEDRIRFSLGNVVLCEMGSVTGGVVPRAYFEVPGKGGGKRGCGGGNGGPQDLGAAEVLPE